MNFGKLGLGCAHHGFSPESIGKVLKRERKARIITLFEMAEKTCISISELEKIESGITESPSYRTISMICYDGLHMSIKDFDWSIRNFDEQIKLSQQNSNKF